MSWEENKLREKETANKTKQKTNTQLWKLKSESFVNAMIHLMSEMLILAVQW